MILADLFKSGGYIKCTGKPLLDIVSINVFNKIIERLMEGKGFEYYRSQFSKLTGREFPSKKFPYDDIENLIKSYQDYAWQRKGCGQILNLVCLKAPLGETYQTCPKCGNEFLVNKGLNDVVLKTDQEIIEFLKEGLKELNNKSLEESEAELIIRQSLKELDDNWSH
jgi:hypothetical protein